MDFLYCLVCLREILLHKKIKTWKKSRVVTAPVLKFRVVSRPPCPRLAARLGTHVEYVKKTVSSNLGMLNRIRNYVSQSSLHSLFVCLVTPPLDYCCTVWGGRYIYHDNILNKCLKRAARIILQISRYIL